VAHAANAPAQQPAAPANIERIRDYLSEQTSQIYSEMDRDGVAGLTPAVSDVLTPLMNSYVYNDRFLNIPIERLQALLGELGQQIELLEMQGEYERAAASRLSDFHNAIEYALQDLQRPAPAQQPQNIVPRGNDIDPEELRDAFLSGARVRLDDRNYEIVRDHVQGIGQYLNSRDEPEEFVSMVRQAADMVLDANARDLLQSYANQIENLYGPPTQAQQPTEYRPATQDQASAALMQINREIGNQARLLSDEHNEAITQLFATSIGTLYTENNLNEVGDTPASLTRFGYYLQGYRDDLAAQIPYLNREGFMGVAAASAIQNVINAIDTQLVDFRSRPTEDVQARTEQSLIQEVRSALDNNELGAEDLRSMAGSMEPFVGDPRWDALSEQTRRTAIRDLRAMANFIEFSPRDFAQQLINEEGPEHYDDAITLLENNDYDHPVLQGLPPVERGRAAQGTALAMQRILDDETQLRALNPNGIPPAPVAPVPPISRQQQRMIERVPQITDMLIDFSVDDPITTAADYRRIANILRDPRNAREFLEDVMDVGSSLGDFVLRASDLRGPALRLVADELESRAANMATEADYDRLREFRYSAEDIAETLEEQIYDQQNSARDAIRLMRQHIRSLRRNGQMALENLIDADNVRSYDWSPDLLEALELTYEDMIERYRQRGRDAGEQGLADGGPVRGYKKGGSVEADDVPTPSLFSVSDYSNFTAKDMYPGKVGIDDQRDAARHMLAAGTLARKYNPWIAEKLGQVHEIKSAPIQHIKSLFGAEMPPDYYMDRHNNEVGSRLGRQARSQSELEDLVQAEAERASRTKTPGQAFILKANGGIVQQNPTTDQMRYELMMRRK
jgi:hypothetical protein